MNQNEYDHKYGFNPKPKATIRSIIRKRRTKFADDFFTAEGWNRIIQRRIPVSRWLPRYNFRSFVVPDFLAGATVGIYNIPQGLAYSVLASLPPVYGLYASFFPPIFYFLFGSSLHSSIGVFSLTCLMVGHTRTSILPDYANGTTATEFRGIENLTPTDVVVALAFVTGAIQLIMAVLHLDFLTSYLSDPAVSGLNFGAACHAFISQLPAILGIKIHSSKEFFFKLIYNFEEIIENLGNINVATTIISLLTIALLILSKSYIEPNTRRLGFPFPTELVIMIFATVVSTLTNLSEHWHVKIISSIPLGMPQPVLPKFVLMPYLIRDGLSIAIVAYAVTVSMGKLMGRKHRYTIDTNQELLALGTSGILSSFFSVFPTSTSLSRTLVNEESGAKTQVSGLVSAIIILSVILFLGPLLEALPMCILSCIVVVALRSLFQKIGEVPKIWKFSKLDTVIWITTAIATICMDIIEGLVMGMIVALFLVIIRTQWPDLDTLGEISSRDYRVLDRYSAAKPPNATILRFDAPLIFTNVETFKSKIRQAVHANLPGCNLPEKQYISRVIVLDCSCWAYTDAMGVEAIKEIHEEMLINNILLMFADLKSHVRIQYLKAGLFTTMNEDQFYPSVHEALQAASMLYLTEPNEYRKDSTLSAVV
ncbi:unnamed protein product [Auanema sp. JU1783]|nr:unnamed protein product [Auanema sp. JU1783]